MKKDNNQNAAQGIHQSDLCLGDDLLFKYVDGRANKSEAEQVEAHLNRYAKCYHELTTLVRYSQSPATKSEKNEIEKNIHRYWGNVFICLVYSSCVGISFESGIRF